MSTTIPSSSTTSEIPTINPTLRATLTPTQLTALEEFRTLYANKDHEEKDVVDTWFHLADDRVLLQFLRARDYDVKKAGVMIDRVIAERSKWRPWEIKATDEDVKRGLLKNGGVWRMMGYTQAGNPIMLVQVKRFIPSEVESVETYTRVLLYELEVVKRMTMEKNYQSERVIVIYDLENYSMFVQGTPTGMKYTNILTDVAQNLFPEFLEKVVLFNAPFVFRAAWAIIRPWLDSKTSSKVQFISDPKVMLTFCDAENLYPCYGGTKLEEWPIPGVPLEDQPKPAVFELKKS
jgi:hypothetical protein